MNETEERRVRIERKELIARDIALFELVSSDDRPLPQFSAGSHIDVALPGGITRQYSLCNDPREEHRYQIAVLRDENGRGGSRMMHDMVHVGSTISISAPRNHFPLAHGARRSILLAGGIGITPLLCMAERLAELAHPFTLHYCTRSADRTAFRDRIAQSSFAARVQLHFDDGDEAQKIDLSAVLRAPEAGVHLYTCGPKGFMDTVLTTARQSAWSEGQLHYEFFGAERVVLEADDSFEVKLASSGRVIKVAPSQSVVQALASEGIQVPTSCEQGVCGTCLTRVLEGEPDHRDLYLTPEERSTNNQFLPCCSRAKSAQLVLDL